MSQLVVRNIEGALVEALERRAARFGRSAEAELRLILREDLACEMESASFKEALASMPDVGEDEGFLPHRDLPRCSSPSWLGCHHRKR